MHQVHSRHTFFLFALPWWMGQGVSLQEIERLLKGNIDRFLPIGKFHSTPNKSPTENAFYSNVERWSSSPFCHSFGPIYFGSVPLIFFYFFFVDGCNAVWWRNGFNKRKSGGIRMVMTGHYGGVGWGLMSTDFDMQCSKGMYVKYFLRFISISSTSFTFRVFVIGSCFYVKNCFHLHCQNILS